MITTGKRGEIILHSMEIFIEFKWNPKKENIFQGWKHPRHIACGTRMLLPTSYID